MNKEESYHAFEILYWCGIRLGELLALTAEDFDYSLLTSVAEKNSEITKTLNHIMQGINFDCSACNLKPICDEVEGMRELHFKNSGMM